MLYLDEKVQAGCLGKHLGNEFAPVDMATLTINVTAVYCYSPVLRSVESDESFSSFLSLPP